MRLLPVLAALLVTASAGAALAADAALSGDWAPTVSNEQGVGLVDIKHLTRSGSLVSVPLGLLIRGASDAPGGQAIILIHQEFDCSNATSRTVDTRIYDAAGAATSDLLAGSPMAPIKPKSTLEYISTVVCAPPQAGKTFPDLVTARAGLADELAKPN